MAACNNPSHPAGGTGVTMPLIALAAIIPMLLAVAAPPAGAVPLVCSDVTHYADRLLTGCALDADPFTAGMGAALSREASRGPSLDVDALLSPAPPNPLVQVGPNGLADAPSEERAANATPPAGRTMKGLSAPSDENPEGSHQSAITKDQNWYYMNVDRDGTYLFFGDPEQLDRLDDRLDRWATFETPDDGLPKGIGIGRRWRF